MVAATSESTESGRAPTRYAVPIFVGIVFAAIVWWMNVASISLGDISHTDEFYTLDRSSSFSIQGDWLTVYTGNEPDFRKPPLQYWMSGLLFELGAGQPLALRIPSAIFALCSLFATGLLAFAISPRAPWAIPCAMVLCASSTRYWYYATSAMLDAGATLFVSVLLAAMILALKRPAWWYVAATAVVLGALQKTPTALLFSVLFLGILFLTSRWHGYSYRTVTRDRHFRAAAVIAFFGALSWHLFQYAQYGKSAFEQAFDNQIVDRFSPFEDGEESRSLYDLWRMIMAREPLLRGLGVIALAWLPWKLRRLELLPLVGVFAIFVVAMYAAGGQVYERYSLIFVPTLTASLAVVLITLTPWTWAGVLGVVAVSAASAGPVKEIRRLGLYPSEDKLNQVAAASDVGALLQDDETLVVCAWDQTSGIRIAPGAVTYYASRGRPYRELTSIGDRDRFLAGDASLVPLRGLCAPSQLEELRAALPDLKIVDETPGYVQWVSGGRPGAGLE